MTTREPRKDGLKKLSKKAIDALKPAASPAYVFDKALTGFGVKVYPSGVKSFFVQYRVRPGEPPRRVKLGRYGALTVDTARRRATAILGEIDPIKGVDPVKKHRAENITVRQLVKRYLKEHAEVRKKPLSVREDTRLLDNLILPKLGSLKVANVSRQHVLALHQRLRKTPIQANRALSLIRTIFNRAEAWGLRPDGSNPTRHVEWFKETRRDRFLSPAELARLGEAIQKVEAENLAKKRASKGAGDAIRLLILTGCRVGEILRLCWEHVDLDRCELRLPDSKTGAKTVPLGAPAREILTRLGPKRDGFVFPGRTPGTALEGIRRCWDSVCKAAGLDGLRLHDLRHSFASVGAMAGLGLPIIGKILGHASPATTFRYAHLADNATLAAAEVVSARINADLERRPDAQVVEIER